MTGNGFPLGNLHDATDGQAVAGVGDGVLVKIFRIGHPRRNFDDAAGILPLAQPLDGVGCHRIGRGCRQRCQRGQGGAGGGRRRGLVTVITTVMATPGLVVAVGGAIVPGVLAVGGTAVAQPTNK